MPNHLGESVDTRLVHAARTTAVPLQSVNPPLVRTSTVTFASLAAYNEAQRNLIFDAPRYGRSGTATSFELQRAMAELAGAETCLATGCGLSAIVAVLNAHAAPGRHILVSAGVYNLTRVYIDEDLTALGVRVEYFRHDADIAALLRDETSLVFLETPASLTMEMFDVRAICTAAHARGVPVASDSTWGTPLFFDAHGLGVDISIHSATKFINGHSDVMLGLVTGSLGALAPVRGVLDRGGAHAAPDACWLTMRGLRTLAVRLRRHQDTALAVARRLQDHDRVTRVLFPALPSDPGHALWQAQFSGAAGPFSFELVPCDDAAFARFIDGLTYFAIGVSWGGFESLVVPALPHHLRGIRNPGPSPRLVRIHVGLEDPTDLCRDLFEAMARI